MNLSGFYKIFLLLSLLFYAYAGAQVSGKDTIQSLKNKSGKGQVKENGGRRSDVFSDKNQISDSDYLEAIEKANALLSAAKNVAHIKGTTNYEIAEINRAANALTLIIENLNGANNNNVRNQQMYRRILLEQQEEIEYHRAKLDVVSDTLANLKSGIRGVVRKDTIFKKIVKDSLLRLQFKDELLALRTKWKRTDSLITASAALINNAKKDATEKRMLATESLEMVSDRLQKSGVSMFGNEYCNLWEVAGDSIARPSATSIAQKFVIEKKAFSYYFIYSIGGTAALLVFMGLIFWWIRYNIGCLKKEGRIKDLLLFKFKYLNRKMILPVIVIGINVAISLNLYAPALYFEFLNLISLLVLTIIFNGQWSPRSFNNWLLLVLLFVLFCFMDLFIRVSFVQRCVFMIINLLSIRFGLIQLKTIKEELYIKVFFTIANTVFIGFNVLAVIFNLFGRVSLAHTLSLTAVTALTQIIALSVFLKMLLETIILQMYTIRIRRGIVKLFDYQSLEDNLKKPLLLLVTYLWIVVIASNLNLTDTVYSLGNTVLTHQNKIGSFSFTIGSIILFCIIIWLAHILQRYVAYFFGEIDEEDEESINKRQHSKLLITRLLVLVGGYLLAISASGMPLDKITIVLGALGVGVGLGLQSIVNNFVSGVILIFDRPIQIGDVIEAGNQTGRVKSIGLRTTKVDTANGAEVIIPNGNMLSQNIVNWTFSNNYKLTDISFTLTGETDHKKIIEIINISLSSVALVYMEKDPQIFFDSVSAGSCKITLRFWCTIFRTDQALSEVRVSLYNNFKNNGVELAN